MDSLKHHPEAEVVQSRGGSTPILAQFSQTQNPRLTLHWNPTMLSLSSTTSLCPISYTPSLYLMDGVQDGFQDGYLAYSIPQTSHCLHRKPAVGSAYRTGGKQLGSTGKYQNIQLSNCSIGTWWRTQEYGTNHQVFQVLAQTFSLAAFQIFVPIRPNCTPI